MYQCMLTDWRRPGATGMDSGKELSPLSDLSSTVLPSTVLTHIYELSGNRQNHKGKANLPAC
jgi:hypothetical protein